MFKTNLNAVSSDVTDVNDEIVATYRIGGRNLPEIYFFLFSLSSNDLIKNNYYYLSYITISDEIRS